MVTKTYEDKIAEEGERIYARKLKRLLCPKYKGRYVAIEVESCAYFFGETPIEAALKGKKRFPNKVYYLKRIGFKSVFHYKNRNSL